MQENEIALQVNCLWSTKHNRPAIAFHANLDCRDGLLGRAALAAKKISATLAQGQNVLVHCAHGVHRTGSMICLWQTLLKDMPGSTEEWHQMLRSSYEDFAVGRRLQARSTRRHNYEAEVGPCGTQSNHFQFDS
jgi:protein tyrosine phosphatase